MIFTPKRSSGIIKTCEKAAAEQPTNLIKKIGKTGGAFFAFRLLALKLLIFFPSPGKSESTLPIVSLAPDARALPCTNDKIAFDFLENVGQSHTSRWPKNTFWMMWFAMRTFTSDTWQTAWEIRQTGLQRYRSFNNRITGLQGYVAGDSKALVLAFRGSTEFVDWIVDGTVYLQDASHLGLKGRVHTGFATSFLSEWNNIKKTIYEFGKPDTPIFITGHSLGGALATIAAYKLASEGFNIGGLYSFAAPRSGDAVYSEYGNSLLGRKIVRVVNDRDLVVRYPPRAESLPLLTRLLNISAEDLLDGWLKGQIPYAHHGKVLMFDHEGETTEIEDDDTDLDDDLHIWSTMAEFYKWKGLRQFVLEIATKQKKLHNEKSYLCLMNSYRELKS